MDRRADFSRFSVTDGVRADLKRKSIRGAAFVAYGGAADIIIRFLSIAILARFLLPEDFGLIAMVAALTGVVDSFRDLGLSAATVQRPDITHAQVTNLFWVNVAVGVLFTLALFALSPLIAQFYGDDRLIGVAAGLALVFLWSGLTVQHEALMSRQLRQGEIALIRVLASVLSTGLAIWLAIAGWGFWALVWREVSRSALIAVGVWLRCPWLPGVPRRHVGTRSLVRFGGELSATNLFGGLIANIDKLLIGKLFGAVPVGLYRQAQQLLLAPIEQLNFPIMSVAQPALSALQGDPARYRRYYEKIVFVVTCMTLPVGLFVAIYAEEVTLLLLGPKWADAAIFVRIFGLAAMMRPAIGTSYVVLVTCGLSTRMLAIAVAHGVVLTALLAIGTGWGAAGVAWAHVATTVVLMVPKLYFSFLSTPVTLAGFFSAIRPTLVAGIAMAAALALLRHFALIHGTLFSLAAGATAAAVVYGLALWLQAASRGELKAMLLDVREALRRKRSLVSPTVE